MRGAEVDEQLLVGRCLLERVELGAMQVFQQRIAQPVVVVGLPDDRGDRPPAGAVAGPPPARPPGRPATAERPPLRRTGGPSGIAAPAVFRLSEAAAWMTGQTVVVDGGFTIQ